MRIIPSKNPGDESVPSVTIRVSRMEKPGIKPCYFFERNMDFFVHALSVGDYTFEQSRHHHRAWIRASPCASTLPTFRLTNQCSQGTAIEHASTAC